MSQTLWKTANFRATLTLPNIYCNVVFPNTITPGLVGKQKSLYTDMLMLFYLILFLKLKISIQRIKVMILTPYMLDISVMR